MGFYRDGLKGSSLRVFTEEEAELIHKYSLELLEEKGILIHHEDTLKLLKNAGCKVDFSSKMAQIPAELVENSIQGSPNRVKLCGRNDRYDIELGDGTLYTRTTSGAPYIIDLDTQKQRKATKEDLAQSIRLADALPNIHGVSIIHMVPMDMPVELIDLYSAETSFNNTEKHLFYVCHNEDFIELVIEMAALIAGGEDKLRERPLLCGFCEVTSPLQLDRAQMKLLWNYTKRGIPVYTHSHPMGGLTAPVTLAGEAVQMNAETLAVLAIGQLINPGAPIIYGTSASVPNMKTGSNLSGAIEIGLLGSALAQMAKKYHLPCDMTCGTDSKTADAQASIEKIFTALPSILSGIDLLDISTTDTKLTFSLDQLVIDNEIISWIARLLKGIKVDEEHLAIELIKKVSHSNDSFITQAHTAKYLREELMDSELMHRKSWGEWVAQGSTSLKQRAHEKAKMILKDYKPVPLSEEVQKGMTKIIESAKSRI